jgi:hypothetical protein
LLDVTTGKVEFLCAGSVVDIVKSGFFAGDIIVHHQILPRGAGATMWTKLEHGLHHRYERRAA